MTSRKLAPAVWMPTIRAGTGADVFAQRLCDGLNAYGTMAEITWLPHRAEYLPWSVPVPPPPPWANVVHINSWLPERFLPAKLPVVLTVHHLVHDPLFAPFRSVPQATYHDTIIRRRELRNIRAAAVVTTVSEYVKETVNFFSGRKDIIFIPNWVDAHFRPGQLRRSIRFPPYRLFMAGSQTRRKGIDLLTAFSAALGKEFKVRFAGSKKPLATKPDGVVELGRVDSAGLIQEYQECDAVVSLSRYEGFGYTALEALACGKPFFGFSTSGLIEVVDSTCATLVANGDVSALAAACRSVITNNSLLASYSNAALKRAASFGERRSITSYMDAYRAALDSLQSRR